MKAFECTYNATLRLIGKVNAAEIQKALYYGHNTSTKEFDEIALAILEIVAKYSNSFKKDIAAKALANGWALSEKQAWCVAFEYAEKITEAQVIEYYEALPVPDYSDSPAAL